MTDEQTDPPLTPERAEQLVDLAIQIAAADAYVRLWGRVYADYKAGRSPGKAHSSR
jgi:hypothetical protein